MSTVVCVTGASGFIASWLVKLLLQRGYTVNATVRNIRDSGKVDHLKALEGAKERLLLFQADLLEQGSFDAAVEGCHGVFHTASPVEFENITDPQKEIIDPAVEGTLNVLHSCAKVPSIKRVVLTSSMSSVMASKKVFSQGAIVDESWFSDAEYCRETEQWYTLSKTLAEEAATQFVQGSALDLVVMNPGLTIGKVAPYGMPLGHVTFVDVRDVAQAHILALEELSAEGRYCLVQKVVTVFDILRVIYQHYPTLLNHQPSLVPGQLEAPLFQVSNEKAKSLGVEFTCLETSVKDTIDNLLEKKLINL